ncbi:MAG: ArsR family transcriptional regulator [Euzebya sp.]
MTGRVVGDPDDPARQGRATVHAALGDPTRLAIVEALLDSDLAPDEVARDLGLATNGLAHHLRVLRDARLVDTHTSHGDRRRRYLTLHRPRLNGLVQQPSWTVDSVLFVCTANAARSQMASALWNQRSPVPSTSAGHQPAKTIPSPTRKVLAAHGLPAPSSPPRSYDEIQHAAGLVISVCDVAREHGVPFDSPRLHWSIPDPLGGTQSGFDATFEEIAERIDHVVGRVFLP